MTLYYINSGTITATKCLVGHYVGTVFIFFYFIEYIQKYIMLSLALLLLLLFYIKKYFFFLADNVLFLETCNLDQRK